MNNSRYKEITMGSSSLPIRWMWDNSQTLDAIPMATTGNMILGIPLFPFMRRWGNASVHRCFFTIKRDPERPLFFVHHY